MRLSDESNMLVIIIKKKKIANVARIIHKKVQKSVKELRDPFPHNLFPKNNCYPDNRKWGMQV